MAVQNKHLSVSANHWKAQSVMGNFFKKFELENQNQNQKNSPDPPWQPYTSDVRGKMVTQLVNKPAMGGDSAIFMKPELWMEREKEAT